MNRTTILKSKFEELKIDAFFVTNILNVRYLTGFSGSAGLAVITKKKNYFITDFRYKIQSKKQVSKDFEIMIYPQGTYEHLQIIINRHRIKRIGVESNIMTVNEFNGIKKVFPEIKFVPLNSVIEGIIITKNKEEIKSLKKAVEITDRTFSELLKIIKPGVTEKDIAAEITYIQMKLGGEKNAFDPIVASGLNSALPHAQPTDNKIKKGVFVTLDFGTVVDGMHSDMTRTLVIGKANKKQKDIYNIVLDAQLKALEKVKAGISVKQLDSYARDYIASKGYGDNFGHGLGHGLGYYIHEGPRVNPKGEYVLEVNNIITIEPGIYIEGFGGVRIEDDVIVKKQGCEILNISAKELIEL